MHEKEGDSRKESGNSITLSQTLNALFRDGDQVIRGPCSFFCGKNGPSEGDELVGMNPDLESSLLAAVMSRSVSSME